MISYLVEAIVGPVVVGDARRGDIDTSVLVLLVGDGRHVRAVRCEVQEPGWRLNTLSTFNLPA